MNDKYIAECKNFKWLQGQRFAGGTPFDFDGFYYPRLSTLIELLGEDFVCLELEIGWEGEKEWACLSSIKGVAVRNVADTPELACLMALKKIKEDK